MRVLASIMPRIITPAPRARPRPGTLTTLLIGKLIGTLVVTLLTGCYEPPGAGHAGNDTRASHAAPPSPGPRTVPRSVRELALPRADAIVTEPNVRVRIATDQTHVALNTDRADAAIIVGPARHDGAAAAGAHRFRAPVRISRADGRWLLETGSGDFHWAASWLRIETDNASPLTVEDARYPGAVVLVPLSYQGRETGTFDAVNHVPLEAYLPGVVEREMWPSWDPRAFQAQAVAARSYALFEQALNRERHFDLTATTASQVYGGEAENAQVIAAVRHTRGQVVTFQGHILPTFYSSCCGGRSQSAAAAFPHFGAGVNLPPLDSRPRRAWCSASNHYRWGPIQRDAHELTRRLAAWGRANGHAIADLTDIRRIDITGRSAADRPTAFTVTDARGPRFTLPAEHFRFACNHRVEGLPDLPFERQIRSSDVYVSVSGANVRFSQGRGFGHGAGMCQWGAQGMAEQGYDAHAILNEFYPGTRIRRLY